MRLRRPARWQRVLLVGVGLMVVQTLIAAAVAEHELKLALTYKIARFVTWPAERERTTAFSFCTLGRHPFETALDDVKVLKVKERTITVRELEGDGRQTAACDLLFIASSESDRLSEVLVAIADKPVLTVSDMPRFAKRGGAVEIKSRENHLGFEINVQAYRRAGLVISSQLLQLATILDEPEGRGP